MISIEELRLIAWDRSGFVQDNHAQVARETGREHAARPDKP
jgi:hypothetical protein